MSLTNPLISEVGQETVDEQLIDDNFFIESETVDTTNGNAPLSTHFRLGTLYAWLVNKFKVGTAGGVATLDANATLSGTQIPATLKAHWLRGARVGTPPDGEVVLALVPGLALTLPVGLVDSIVRCRVAPAADLWLDLQVNGVSKGSVTIPAGTTAGVASFATAVTLLPDDLVTLRVPTPTDASVQDLLFALKAIAA